MSTQDKGEIASELVEKLERVEKMLVEQRKLSLEQAKEIRRLSIKINRDHGKPSHYLGDYTAMTRMLNGLKILVDTRDVGLSMRLLSADEWETGTTAVLKNVLKKGDVFVDVGANIGYFTLLACRIVGREGMVFSYEPNPAALRLLKKSLQLNGFIKSHHVKTFPFAVSDRRGRLILKFQSEQLMQGSIFKHDDHVQQEYNHVHVQVVNLDMHLSKHLRGSRPDVVKIDAEGVDAKVLLGMEQIIRQCEKIKIIFEYTPRMLEKQIDLDVFWQKVSELGLSVEVIGIKDGSLSMVSTSELLETPLNEMLLLSKG